ncbi:MAG: DEAD/DEAH box helicase, partial [Actinomycetota bacterium]|nr:DEAD/DEAH box helicase [Actinomycetota bacterium]
MPAPADVAGALARVVGALPGGEARSGQLDMARAVAESIDDGRHLLVQAGTGTGKSLGYLVPAILSGRRVVVATATKALQEQLVDKDIPLLQQSLARPFRAALLKGRSNYLCLAALDGATGDAAQGTLVEDEQRRSGLGGEELAELSAWARTTATGDRSDLPGAMPDRAWSSVSVGVGECPGAHRCPSGERCFAERAKWAAAEADVVVVNTHLYGAHLRSGGFVLPDHEVVVIDEAHAFEDVAADSLGAAVGPVRLEHLARACRGLFTA